MSASKASTRSPDSNDIITLKAGSIDFHVQSSALTKASTYFKALFAPHMTGLAGPARAPDGAIIVLADPEAFRHIITYAQYKTFPLFYEQKSGSDLGRYAEVYHLAKYYGVDRLAEWIGEKKYADVFKRVTYRESMTRHEYERAVQEGHRETGKAKPKRYEGEEEVLTGFSGYHSSRDAAVTIPVTRHRMEVDYDALVDTSCCRDRRSALISDCLLLSSQSLQCACKAFGCHERI